VDVVLGVVFMPVAIGPFGALAGVLLSAAGVEDVAVGIRRKKLRRVAREAGIRFRRRGTEGP